MGKRITVSQAVFIGQLTVNGLVMFFLVAPGLTCNYLSNKGLLPDWSVAAAVGVGFVSAWLSWSIMITKWRIWAFENVEDLQGLKEMAISQRLIWPDGGIFEKTEIRTRADKVKLKAIQKKFDQSDFDN